MESAKKILPYILIAIVFAVGGYFIGKGAMGSQQASLYKAASAPKIGGVVSQSTTGPTGGYVALTGAEAVDGIKYFQNMVGLSQTGTLDAATIAKIEALPKVTDPAVIAKTSTVNPRPNEWVLLEGGNCRGFKSSKGLHSLGCWIRVINTAQTMN